MNMKSYWWRLNYMVVLENRADTCSGVNWSQAGVNSQGWPLRLLLRWVMSSHVISLALGAKGNLSLGSWLQLFPPCCKALELSTDPRSFLSWDGYGFSWIRLLSQTVSLAISPAFLQQGEFWINLLILMYWYLACSDMNFIEWGCFWLSNDSSCCH